MRVNLPTPVFSKGQGQPSQSQWWVSMAQQSMVPMTPVPTWATDISTYHNCIEPGSDMTPGSSSGPDTTKVPVLPQATQISMAPVAVWPQIPTWSQASTTPWASAEPSMVIGVMTITWDPGHCRATGLNKALGSSLGLGASIAPGDSRSHQYGPGSCMVIGHWCSLRWLTTRPCACTGSSVVTGATGIHSDPSCCRVMNSDMKLCSRPAWSTP